MVASHRLSILKQLRVSEHGLSPADVEKARADFGFNEIPERRQALWKLLLSQFNDAMVFVLLGAVGVSLAVPLLHQGSIDESELLNAAVIMAIVVINAALGFIQEWRAENAIALLKKLSAPNVKVRRDGTIRMLPARELVPGDIMIVEAGDRISADARIVASSSSEVDESSLTGESVPAVKRAEEKLEKGFSTGMLYAGTLMTRGSAEAVTMHIALGTEIGKITSMVMELKPPPTPLQIELQKTGKRIGILVLVLCVAIFVIGLAKGMGAVELFFTAVSLAVAAVPEGLPAIVTICLAIGVQRMIGKHALVRRLDAVETLGNVSVICADKTGTMTENRMKVTDIWAPTGVDPVLLATAAASCNRAELPDIGDPTEIALLVYAEQQGAERIAIDEEDVPFTSEAKYMVTSHIVGGRTVRFYKGAPEVIARFVSPAESTELLKRVEEFSGQGLRVLAMAQDAGGHVKSLGLVAMMDPPRAGVKEAIERAHHAGIRTIMITGDHPATALTIARKVGIVSENVIDGNALEAMDIDELKHQLRHVSVFARVQPAHKVMILRALQETGEIVSMSGDGVNDAPALKKAHVGVGMGLKGTDVAREAAAMVLTDDNYATIVAAIAEGRRIYDNIKKFVIFLVRCNLGEVLTIAGAMFLGMPLPLLPLHILWINLVTDSFPALALAAEPAEKGIMSRPPRPQHQGIFTGEWTLLVTAGVLNMIVCLGVFWLALKHFPGDLLIARSATLTASIIYQLLMALSCRSRLTVFQDFPFKNKWLMAAIATSVTAHALLLFTPLSRLFTVTQIPLIIWEEMIGGALLAFLIFECLKWVKNRK